MLYSYKFVGMLEQLDLFSTTTTPESEIKPEEKLKTAFERRLRPPVVVIAPEEPEAIQQPEPVSIKIVAEPTVPSLQEDAEIKVVQTEEKKSTRGRKSIKEMGLEAARIDVPADDILYQKQYYGIGEVAAMFQVNASLLRYWESEFDILKPRKNRKGDRFFRPDDIKNLQRIHHLLRERKYTIDGARTFLKATKKSGAKFEAIETLKKIKGFLLELKAGLS